MVKKDVTIVNETGLHARPASEFVNKCKAFQCEVLLEKDETQVNAKSILGVLSLGANKGTKITIITDGPDEEEAASTLAELISSFKD